MKALAMLVLFANIAIASGDYPTNTDLKAAYCLPYWMWLRHLFDYLDLSYSSDSIQVSDSIKIETAAKHKEARINSERLESYIRTRMLYVDPIPMSLAAKAFDSDTAMANGCATTCFDLARVCDTSCAHSKNFVQCIHRCSINRDSTCLPSCNKNARYAQCSDMSFLPF